MPGGVSVEVLILVLPPIWEGLELVYLSRPGDLCCGGVGNHKVCLNTTGICPYRSHSKKASKNGCEREQDLSMFNDGAIKTERAFEEKIGALATAKKVIQEIFYPARIKERDDSTPVIDSIREIQAFLQNIENPQEAVKYLNVINPINEPTGYNIQLKLTLKNQAELVDILVQTVSGVI